MKKIVLEKLNKYYHKGTKNEIHVIDNTSLEFDSTGLVCLLGESGSGKTTLLNVISGIDKPRSGKIYIDGEILKSQSSKSEPIKNNKFGYVFQNYYMINDDSVYENLRLALAPYHLNKDEIDQRIDYVLNAVDMMRFKKRKVNQLSGGQAQRIAIARALIKAPDVIFADEPTGNLDESTTLKIMTILKNISKKCLVIVATHEKRIAEFFANRILTIKDGKVINDRLVSEHNNVYNLVDDHNLYLKEYQKSTMNNDLHYVNVYQNNLNEKLYFSVIIEHGKYYIYTDHPNRFEIIKPDTHIQAIDDYKPVMDMAKVNQFKYHLDAPSKVNNGKLSWKELFSKVVYNSRSKSFLIMVIALIMIAVISVIAVGDYMTISQDKVQEQLVTDSRVVDLKFSEDSNIDLVTLNKYLDEFYDIAKKELKNTEMFIASDPYAYLLYDGFKEIENTVSNTSTVFNGFSYVPLEYLDESKIIAGNKPLKLDEVVVDRYVLEAFMAQNNVVAKSLTKIEAFLGMTFKAHNTGFVFKIVGIAETNNKAVYANRYSIISATSKSLKVANLDYLKQLYPTRYVNVELNENQVMLTSENYNPMYKTKSVYGFDYDVYHVTVPNQVGVNVVMSDEGFDKILKKLIIDDKSIRFITEDKSELDSFLDKVFNTDDEKYAKIRDNVQYVKKDLYKSTVDQYYKERHDKILARVLVTGSIFLMCIATLFVTMKAHANTNMQSIMVYRLLGFKKSVVVRLYMIEIFLTSIIVMVPVSLVAVGVMKFLAAMPASTFEFALTLPAYLLTMLALFIINIIVGILPVALIMRKTPAQLVSEYDL